MNRRRFTQGKGCVCGIVCVYYQGYTEVSVYPERTWVILCVQSTVLLKNSVLMFFTTKIISK